jgi:hypothetical protein
MKRVIIRNLSGIQTHGAEMPDPQSWIDDCVVANVWGKTERWILASESHDEADVIERESREVQSAMAAVIDEEGSEVSPAVPAVVEEWVKLRAEYTISIEDISAEHALQQALSARKSEYPSAEEFLNAFFDGGDEALEELRQRRLAIKVKYPKE